jgi:DnaJ like chaperone protein
VSWWGKVIGGTFGFMLGGPLGALVGAALGHQVDSGRRRAARAEAEVTSQERTQTAFFTASFAVMGRLAKADGRVTADEIQIASAVMDHMRLGPELRQAARSLFSQGKEADFPLDQVLGQLRRECHRSRNLLRVFLEIQLQAAYADGVLHPQERALLLHMAERLGFSAPELDALEALLHAQRPAPGPSQTLADDFALLGVSPAADAQTVKRAYRRLMSQHHPDKLVARGLPEEMMKVATAKTQAIRAAYERIRAARGA